MSFKRKLVGALAGVMVLGLSIGAPRIAQAQPQGTTAPESVYVRDSALALEKFALAQRMEGQQWNTAAEVYNEILEKYADRVVPSQKDSAGRVYQYTSVATAVQERLAKWPDEGLKVYRQMYEPAAQSLLESVKPGDKAGLHKIIAMYFATETAKVAALRLIDQYLESGEFPAASWLSDRMLKWHPSIQVERPKFLYRAAMAYHLSNDDGTAKERLDQLAKDFPEARGLIAGKDALLTEALTAALKSETPRSIGTSGNSWPMFGGSPERSRIPKATGRPGARIYSIELGVPKWKTAANSNPAIQQQLQQQQQMRQAGLVPNGSDLTGGSGNSAYGVMPAVDGGELFFQDGATLYAVNLESGEPLPRWKETYPNAQGRYTISDAAAMPRNQQLCVSLTPDLVLAIMGAPDGMTFQGGMPAQFQRPGLTRLVCLDRSTGKEKWKFFPNALPDDAQTPKTLEFVGSPLVIGDNVFAVARGAKGQFDNCYVVCVGLNDGAYRWSTFIASTNAGNGIGFNDDGTTMLSQGTSHLSYSSGRLFVLTNMGAMAAVDAYTGSVVWLDIYRRNVRQTDPQFRGGGMPGMTTDLRSWTFNPVIVAEGKLFVLPEDSAYIYVYDAGDGKEVKRLSTSDLGNADTLLAIDGKWMILSGQARSDTPNGAGTLYRLDWANFDARKRADAMNMGFASRIAGRGFVTREAIFIPTENVLLRIEPEKMRTEESYPEQGWDAGHGRGNLLVTDNEVLIAGAERVEVFTRLEVARAKLDRQVAAAPKSPQERLRYAEVMFAAGHVDVALEKLDEAIDLTAHSDPPAPDETRDRVFNDALAFARQMSRTLDPEKKDVTLALFERAQAAARSPNQRLGYFLSYAVFSRDHEDRAQELSAYHEVLADPELRTLSLSDTKTGSPIQAGVAAKQAIDRVIKLDRKAYAPFEQKALDAMKAAADDPDRLLDVAQTYPNSSVATKAMFAAADAYEAKGENRAANQTLRQLYSIARGTGDAPGILEAQARNYLAMSGDHADAAIGRLAQGAKVGGALARLQKPLKLPGGKTINQGTFTEAIEQLRQYSSQVAEARLPEFKLRQWDDPKYSGEDKSSPFLPEAEGSVIPNINALLVPHRDFSRTDRVVTWSKALGLAVWEIGQKQPLMSVKLDDEPTHIAWIDDGLIAWNGTSVWKLRTADALTVAWRSSTKDLPALEVMASSAPDDRQQQQMQLQIQGGQNVQNARVVRINGRLVQVNGGEAGTPPTAPSRPGAEQIEDLKPAGDRIVLTTTQGRIIALDAGTGKVGWQVRTSASCVMQIVCTEDFSAAYIVEDATIQIVSLDTFSGEILYARTFRKDSGRYPLNIALSADGILVYTLPAELCVKDLFEPGEAISQDITNNQGTIPFMGMTGPDKLIVYERRILALSDNGAFVREHLLDDATPVLLKNDANTPSLRATGSAKNTVRIYRQGNRLFAVGEKSLISYNLDVADDLWAKEESDPNTTVLDTFIGRDFVITAGVLTNNKVNDVPRAVSTCEFDCISRLPSLRSNGKLLESGLWMYTPQVDEADGFTAFQGVDGGVYYLSGDRKLHFLRGGHE